ncbi:hypothetical protein [Acinetobacter seifertii]|uniref:hypothetical protein n=3 Tax=Acinetobacter seifertii TaxID=1530123 RepID=UPI00168B4EC9|nr:hypothetical protein [Acinetobacter seifertii]QNX34405.1 hypothetical protein IC788_03485 [Acinetobacter seifertii]
MFFLKKIMITLIVWLLCFPFFFIALALAEEGGGNGRKIFEHLFNLSDLYLLTRNELFEEFIFPLSIWIAIIVLFFMNIGWMVNKRINRYIIYIGSICGLALSAFALMLTMQVGIGLLLLPGIFFAIYLIKWHLEGE